MSFPELYNEDGTRDYDYEDRDDNYCTFCGRVDDPESPRHDHTERNYKMTLEDLPADYLGYAMPDEERGMHEIEVDEIHQFTEKAILISGTMENVELSNRWIPRSQLFVSGTGQELLVSDWVFTKLSEE